MIAIKKLLNKERGLFEYKLKGESLTDVYGTPIKIQDTSGIDNSIWISNENKEQTFKSSTGETMFPFFRLDKKGAQKLITILECFIEQG